MRSEWIAAGHQIPSLEHLGSLQRYKKQRAGCSKNVGAERKNAQQWKKIGAPIIIGGCCRTNPEYIKKLADQFRK